MRKGLFIFLLLLPVVYATAQLSLTPGYVYLQSDEWNRIMHMYNFSRPWQKNELRPLTHSYDIKAGWMIRIREAKSFYAHPQLGFRQFNSRATNNKEELFVRLRQYSLQVDLNFNPRAIFRKVSAGPIGTRFMMYVSPSLQLWRPHVEQNGASFYSENGEEYRPYTFGWSLGAGFAYRSLRIAEKFILSPKFGVRLCPGVELENFSKAVQGNNAARLQNKSNAVWLWESGMEIVWIFPMTKSGKGFQKPCSNC